MKTLSELKQNVLVKIEEIRSLEDKRNAIDMDTTNERGFYLNIDAYLEAEKQVNYSKASLVRMIKNLIKRMYGNDWFFPERYDYLEAIKEFKRFC